MLLEHEKDFYGRAPDELPDDAQLADADRDSWPTELRALREAPVIDPYTGPAILMEEAAGVFFHETVGHRLEGERQNDEKEGRTFKGQVGQHVLPDFLVGDRRPDGAHAPASVSLNGYYTLRRRGRGRRAR